MQCSPALKSHISNKGGVVITKESGTILKNEPSKGFTIELAI